MGLGYRSLPVVALVAVAAAVPAISSKAVAQTSTYNTTCDKKPSDSDENAAHAYFTIGKKAYDEADYTKAIDNLKEAYRLDCTKPILLNYIASAYIAKGDKAEAIAALEAFTKRDPKAADAEGVPRKIANLKAQLGSSSSSATTTTTTTTTTTSTTPTSTGTTTAPTATDTGNPPPPGGEERHHTALPWIVVGIGAAALVPAVILLAVGTGKVNDSFALCPNATCPPLPNGTQDMAKQALAHQINADGRTLQNAGIIVGIVGVAAIGGGLLWHFIEPTGPAKTGSSIRPIFGLGYAGVAGAF
jgi:tetratricopeptide (TPR) repeat protein